MVAKTKCIDAILETLTEARFSNTKISPKQLKASLCQCSNNITAFSESQFSRKYKQLVASQTIREVVELSDNETHTINLEGMNSALLFVTFRPHKENRTDDIGDIEYYSKAARKIMRLPNEWEKYKKAIYVFDANVVLGTEHDMFFKVRYSTNELLATFLLETMRPLEFVHNTTTRIVMPIK